MLAQTHKPATYRIDPSVRAGWKPRERIPVSTWADRHRVLIDGYSAEPGPWRTSRTPYLKDVMDAFCDPGVSIIVFVKSARVGATEAGNNMIGFAIDQDPGPILYVYPDQNSAEEECFDRLRPMIEGSPRLRDHIPHGGWAQKQELELDSLKLYMAWAGSDRTLIRRTIRFAFVDELDNCEQHSGRLGDTLKLVQKRLVTYRDRGKTVLYNTPTTSVATGWRTWEKSDKRRYHVPCPLCGAYQVLLFDRIRIPEGERDGDKIILDQLAWYECAACAGRLNDKEHKRWMVQRGVWLPECQAIIEPLPIDNHKIAERAVFDHQNRWIPAIRGTKPRARTVGFHIWAGYSPWLTWSEIIAEFVGCKDNPEELRVFVNSVLGEPWRSATDEVPEDAFAAKRVGALPRDVVPDAAQVLICSADVQKDHLYYVIRAWGPNKQSWLIREGVVADLDDLHAVATQEWQHEDGKRTISPAYLAIDSGYRTFEVYDFALTHPGVYAIKGQPQAAFPVSEKNIEYVPQGRLKTTNVKLYHVDSGYFKEMLYRMAKIPLGDPGSLHLNRDASADYCQQFTSEHQVWVTVKGKRGTRRERAWMTKRDGAPNHFLDCEVYGLAIAYHRRVLQLKELDVTTPAVQSPPNPFGKRPMGWSRSLTRGHT